MAVELDIFSGRPNPRFELDPRGRAALGAIEAALAPAGREPPEPPGLGYRGFVYPGEAGGQHRAWHGFVRTPTAVLADPTFSVERFLLERLPEEHAALRHGIGDELASADRGAGGASPLG